MLSHHEIATRRSHQVADAVIHGVILVIAFVIQLSAFATSKTTPLFGDMIHYNHTADMLLTKHVLAYWHTGPDAQVTPGYPLFLAVMKRGGHFSPLGAGEGLRFIALGQCLLNVVVPVLLYQIGRRFVRPLWAGIAAILWAIYPPFVESGTQILTEALYVFLLCLFVWLLLRATERRTRRAWLFAGLTLGACTLVRPTVFPLIIACLVYFGVRWRTGSTSMRQLLVFSGWYIGGCLVFLGPWWIRNWVSLHRVVLTSDDLGDPLLFGSIPGDWQSQVNIAVGLSSDQQKHLAIQRIMDGFSHQPWLYLKWYTLDKLWILFSAPWYITTASGQWWYKFHIVWVLLGCLGIGLCLGRPTARWFAGLVLFLVVVQLPFIPLPRYVYPIMPFLFIGIGMLLQKCANLRNGIVSFWRQAS